MGLFGITNNEPKTEQVQQVVSISSAVSLSAAHLKGLTLKAKEQADDVEGRLMLHEGYATASEAVKQAQKGRKDARSAVVSDDPDLEAKIMELKQVRADVAAERTRLSELLLEYERSTGQASFETPDGTLLSIRKTASVQLSLF